MKNIIQQLKTKLTTIITRLQKKPEEEARLKKLTGHITHSLSSLDELDKILGSHTKTDNRV